MKKLLATLLLLTRVHAFAWSGQGHMTIAAIAYRDLSTNDQQRVLEVLKSHPDYAKWTNGFSGEMAPADLGAYVFERASTWPDEIRRKGNSYDHPNWHFVDYPLEEPAFPDKPDPFPTNSVIYGIGQA